jgi:hypothetical protein
MTFLIDDLLRARRALRPSRGPACFVCHETVKADQPAMRVRGSLVHRGCATYRMRNQADDPRRLGYPH